MFDFESGNRLLSAMQAAPLLALLYGDPSLLSAAVFVLAALYSLVQLAQRRTYIPIRCEFQLLSKLAIAGTLMALQLQVKPSNDASQSTMSTHAMKFLESALLCLLVLVSHCSSPSPSFLLSVHLPLETFLRVRSFWLSSPNTSPELASIILTVSLLLLHEQPKWSQIPEENRQHLQEQDTLGLWTKSVFLWVFPILRRARAGELTLDMLMKPPKASNPFALNERFQTSWAKDGQKKNALLKIFIKAHWSIFLRGSISALIVKALNPCLAFLIERFIRTLELRYNETDPLVNYSVEVYQLTLQMFCLLLGLMAMRGSSASADAEIKTRLRGLITVTSFNKLLSLSDQALSKFADFSLLRNDLVVIQNCVKDFQDISTSLLSAVFCSCILWQSIGLNMVAAILTALGSVILCGFLGEQVAVSRQQWGQDSKARVTESAKLIQSIKYAKMTGATNLTTLILNRLQKAEATSRSVYMKKNTLRFTFVVATHAITPIFAFGSDLFRSGKLDNIPLLLKSVALIYWFSEDLMLVLEIPEIWATAISSCSRVEALLRTTALESSATPMRYLEPAEQNRFTPAIKFQNVSLAPVADRAPILTNVSLSIVRGSLSVLTGAIGSGKTLFVRGIIGRAHKTQGIITVQDSVIAYCGQDEWLVNGSVRHNIIGDNAYDDAWYTSVMTACVLTEDITYLENGDEFVVTSLGTNMEPAFRQRLALARAVYSRAPVVILDDFLSNQTPITSRRLVAQLFASGGLLAKGRTILVTTSHPEPFYDFCREILHINEHRHVVRRLTPMDRSPRPPQNSDNADQDQSRNRHLPAPGDHPAPEGIASQLRNVSSVPSNYQEISYSVYLRQFNYLLLAAWLLMLFITTCLEATPLVYLRFWLGDVAPTEFPFVRCFALTLLSGLAFGLSGYLFNLKLATKAAQSLHDRFLHTIIGSTMPALSSGKLKLAIDLFNESISTTTRALPSSVFQVAYSFVTMIHMFGVMSSVHKSGLLMAVGIISSLCGIRNLYCYAAQQLKRLQLSTTDDLHGYFAETVTGVPHLQCFRSQRLHMQRVRKAIINTQIVSYNLDSLEACMTMMADMSTLLLVTSFAYILGHGDVHPHLAGLVLVLLLYTVQILPSRIKQWHNMDMAMLDLQKAEEFIYTTPQIELEGQKPALPNNWPTQGLVEFENVSIGYNPAVNNHVITNATFRLEGVQKAAIYGPRQSGKTTLILSMILLLPYEGSIKIDGIEARDIPRDKFKQIFTIIPESPVIFPSCSIRQNLLTDEIIDPTRADAALNPDGIRFLFDDNMDERLTLITKVLHGVGLSDIVRNSGGVDAKFSNLVLSPTQRQKFSLAQGLAKHYATRTKIAIIDSTTSHVNTEGLERMTSLIDEILGVDPDCMVITLASHSDAIEGSQYVARIAGGRVVKFFVESMLHRKKTSKNRVSKRSPKSPATLSEEELVGKVARRSERGGHEGGPRRRTPSPASSSSSEAPQLDSNAVAGPSTLPASPPRPLSPQSSSSGAPSPTFSLTPETYSARRASRSTGSGRHPEPLPEASPSSRPRVEPTRRRRGRTIRPAPVVLPRSPSISDDSDDDTPPAIPGWMADFADDSISELRRHELYTRIFEYGSVKMERLLLRHSLRDNAILQHFHALHHSDEPHILQRQVRDIQTVSGFYHKLQSAIVVARYERQQGRC
ncbi:hypothetical protein VHEMI06119 [[Torrubiella] hemipterigena]|uniref:ABC transporter n=1 Tax=[Torrubiella] hemipterigena TaxID=1531966 RepID=A0A0A1TIN8_9HYPO|nr:hypothetical protein VHEMI06119 [[Torrubiella] hemipterigena]